MLVIRAGILELEFQESDVSPGKIEALIEKRVRIANREDPDQTTS